MYIEMLVRFRYEDVEEHNRIVTGTSKKYCGRYQQY